MSPLLSEVQNMLGRARRLVGTATGGGPSEGPPGRLMGLAYHPIFSHQDLEVHFPGSQPTKVARSHGRPGLGGDRTVDPDSENRILRYGAECPFQPGGQFRGSPGTVFTGGWNQVPYQHRSGRKREKSMLDQDSSRISGFRLQNEEPLSLVHFGECGSLHRTWIKDGRRQGVPPQVLTEHLVTMDVS